MVLILYFVLLNESWFFFLSMAWLTADAVYYTLLCDCFEKNFNVYFQRSPSHTESSAPFSYSKIPSVFFISTQLYIYCVYIHLVHWKSLQENSIFVCPLLCVILLILLNTYIQRKPVKDTHQLHTLLLASSKTSFCYDQNSERGTVKQILVFTVLKQESISIMNSSNRVS